MIHPPWRRRRFILTIAMEKTSIYPYYCYGEDVDLSLLFLWSFTNNKMYSINSIISIINIQLVWMPSKIQLMYSMNDNNNNTNMIVVYYLKELSYGKCHKWRSLESHPFLSTYATSGHSCFFYRNICREDIKICKTLTFNTITNSLKNQDNTYLKRKMQNIISFIITRKWKHHLEMDSSLFMSKPLAIIGKQTIMFTPHQYSRY